MGYYLVEPFGQARTDDGFRGLLSMTFNANRGKSEPVGPDVFMPTWEPPKVEETDDEALMAFFERRLTTRSDC